MIEWEGTDVAVSYMLIMMMTMRMMMMVVQKRVKCFNKFGQFLSCLCVCVPVYPYIHMSKCPYVRMSLCNAHSCGAGKAIGRHLRRCHNMSPPNTGFLKWSNGVKRV